ncbi:hypothetical protein BT93_B1640 [Corymbia citriodora subsp. variegata]|nr:hypothetical protein BT93_B1640 [Corymbia citriodora subsp. variegata]
MYLTRPRSMYWKRPEILAESPPEGPGSGFLVIQDKKVHCCCFGQSKDRQPDELPFPQNRSLTIWYPGMNRKFSKDEVFMVPVIGEALSCNQYCVIPRRGKHKGKAHANLKKNDQGTCLCFRCHDGDKKPSPLNPADIYQRFVIYRNETRNKSRGFDARSLVSDGHPPTFLKSKGWTLHGKKRKNFSLDDDAQGVDDSKRSKLPSLDFPINLKSSDPVVVGKWYCPFMFIKDEKVRHQIKMSAFYEMTLQQKWQQVHACDNPANEGNAVEVDVVVQKEAIKAFGEEAGEGDESDGVMWFRRKRGEIGLSKVIVEGMRFGCYVLVESFVLKRKDGTEVLAYDFTHTHQVRSKWE